LNACGIQLGSGMHEQIQELAREAGESTGLAARSLNGAESVSDEGDDFADADESLLDDEIAIDGDTLPSVSIGGEALDFNKHKEAFEREFIVKALKTFKGRINQTALHANIPKKTLLRKIEKYGIIARDYADPK
jgi:DNA-binding NtrC family response regulator